MMLSMPAPARDALELYLKQNSRRSLRQLARECARDGIKAALPTLKRWSSRYGWHQKAAEHDRAMTERSMAITINHNVRALRAHFKLLDSAKKRYDGLGDARKPDSTPAGRKRALKITVSDYIRLLKAEDVLYKRLERFERIRSDGPASPAGAYTDEEVQVMMNALARHRHGLPGDR